MKLIYFLWTALDRFGANVISLVGNIVLSYFVTQKDFGIVSALSIFTSIVFVFTDCGLSDGIMRYKDAKRKDFNTLFWFNVLMGVVLLLLFNIMAPFMANYFEVPEVEGVMRFFGVGALVGSMLIAQETKLRYNLEFSKLTRVNLLAVFSGVLTGILMGYLGFGYWSIAFVYVGYRFFALVYLMIFTKWEVRFEFSLDTFKDLWRFGVNLMLSVLTSQIAQNIYGFILGKYYSMVQTGYFGQAQKLQHSPTYALESTISTTSYALLTKEPDEERLRTSALSMYGVALFVMMSFIGMFFALSFPIIDVLFAERWLPVVPYLRLLLILGMFQALSRFMQMLLKVYNRTRNIRNIVIVENLMIIFSVYILYPYGVLAMLIGSILVSMVMLNIYALFVSKVSQIKYFKLIKMLVGNAIMMSIPCVVVFYIVSMIDSSVVSLFVGVLLYVVLLLIGCKLCKPIYYEYIKNKCVLLKNKVCDKTE
ncbi:MAG: lipopolysaccharide biosynthesis protein [Muribaculaceae bacterium]|nr:lipopolysaccharide biosynthesis protein [Muribaculaceae bacterium]